MTDLAVPAADLGTTIYDRLESNVRSYCRSFPASFTSAKGAWMWSADGAPYLDFLAGAGALNYGHNHPVIKQALVDYILDDGVVQGLDLHTAAKERFLETLERLRPAPGGAHYKVQVTGPAGNNPVEAPVQMAPQGTGRTGP